MNPDLAFTHASVGVGFHARENGFAHLVRVDSGPARRFANAVLVIAAQLSRAEATPSNAPAVQDLQQATRVGHESRCLPYRIARLAHLSKLALVAANALDPGLLQHRPNARFSPRCRPLRVLV